MRTMIAFVKGFYLLLAVALRFALLCLLYLFAFACERGGDDRFVRWLDNNLLEKWAL